MSASNSAARRVLAIFAHPDDESLLAGGSLAAWAEAGNAVHIVSLTHGERGAIADPTIACRETLGAVREAELHQASTVLGAGATCLDYPDGELAWVDPVAIRADIANMICAWHATDVITFGPEGLYWHPDHVAVHCRVSEAVGLLSGREILPAVYQATWPAGLLSRTCAQLAQRGMAADLWGLDPTDFGSPPETIDHLVDVRRHLPAKLRALRSHRSQIPADHLIATIPDDLAEQLWGFEYFIRASDPTIGGVIDQSLDRGNANG